jgi:hypothetical protein
VGWERLGQLAPRELRGAREQAHWAAQVIAAAGETFLAHEPDTGHTSMQWDADRSALAGRALPGEAGFRVAVRVRDLSVCLLGPGAAPIAELPLPDRSLAEAYRWTSEAIRDATRGALDRPLVHPGFELPPHALARGGRFARDPGLAELACWYGDADGALRRLAEQIRGAGPVQCWPHHFDIATLIEVESAPGGGAARTVGVGLSPGDASIDEPYWYVNHWPTTSRRSLPALAAGEWFREGWVGAVLRGGALVAAGGAAAQEGLLRAFLAAAVPASRALALEVPVARS